MVFIQILCLLQTEGMICEVDFFKKKESFWQVQFRSEEIIFIQFGRISQQRTYFFPYWLFIEQIDFCITTDLHMY